MLIYSTDLDFGNVKLKAGVENLFDKRYNGSVVPNAFGNNFFEPAADRSIHFGLSVYIN